MASVLILQVPTESTTELTKLIASIRNASGNVATFCTKQHEDTNVMGIAASKLCPSSTDKNYSLTDCGLSDWESREALNSWLSSTDGVSTKQEILKLATGPVYEDIVLFSEDVMPSLGATAVELVSWFHPVTKIDNKKKEQAWHGFEEFRKAIQDTPQAEGGLVAGWGEIPLQNDGTLSKRFTLFIGWKSVDAHYECKETPAFLDNIHWLNDNDDDGVEMVHYYWSASRGEEVF